MHWKSVLCIHGYHSGSASIWWIYGILPEFTRIIPAWPRGLPQIPRSKGANWATKYQSTGAINSDHLVQPNAPGWSTAIAGETSGTKENGSSFKFVLLEWSKKPKKLWISRNLQETAGWINEWCICCSLDVLRSLAMLLQVTTKF